MIHLTHKPKSYYYRFREFWVKYYIESPHVHASGAIYECKHYLNKYEINIENDKRTNWRSH